MKGYNKYYDYDSDEFYEELYNIAFSGAYDSQIASALEEKLGLVLSKATFSSMKQGNYKPWTKEENERRSQRIQRVLERARDKTNRLVLARVLKVGLGGITIKSKTTVKRRMEIDGELTDNQIIQTTENESETPPNLQALNMWLYHHNPEWRKVQRGEDIPDETKEAESGIDISQWIEREMNGSTEDV